MTRKEQNKILDAKIESNVNQYKVDRLNAEISAFSSGDLNKYEFLKRIDLNYKPNVLDKARFEFSPLGKTFNTGLDRNAQGYQEEGIIKLLKDIGDGLAGAITPRAPKVPRGSDDDDDDDDDDDEQRRLSKLLGELRTDEDNEEFKNKPKEDKLDKFVNNMPDLETEEEATLNKFKEIIRNKEDEINKTFEDKENRLNKLNNNVQKIKDYIKENNNKLNTIKHKLVYTENERNNLLLNSNQLYGKLEETKNELYETKKRLDEAEDDINEKTKYIDKLKEIQKKVDYQENKIKKNKNKLNAKNKIIKNLENELYNEKQNYIKEKQIIEQELNKKEPELANNKKITNDLNIKIKSLKDDDKSMVLKLKVLKKIVYQNIMKN